MGQLTAGRKKDYNDVGNALGRSIPQGKQQRESEEYFMAPGRQIRLTTLASCAG